MSAALADRQDASPPVLGLRTLHLFTLWNFAVTVPLFSALMQQRIYLHDQQFDWWEFVVLLSLLMAVLPAVCFVADRLLVWASRRLSGWGRDAVFVVLFFLVLLSLFRPYASIPWLHRSGSSALLIFPSALLGAGLADWLYRRTHWFRLWLTVASIGLVIFPGMALWQFLEFRHAEENPTDQIAVENPASVIVVVFDEFSGISLMNDRLEIDAEHFPQFARLAQSATWYRNATSVHPRTDIAVPAILSGRFPAEERSALGRNYPGNLMEIMAATRAYDMAVFETITRLCPDSLAKLVPPPRTRLETIAFHLRTLGRVYPRLILPSDIPVDLPAIPRAWFGVSQSLMHAVQDGEMVMEGLFYYPGNEERDQQLRHFLECLQPSERPRFQFLHIILPHYPWAYFPSGEQYQDETLPDPVPAGASGELGEDWQDDPAPILRNEYRYRMQLGYVDRFLGQLLDRLTDAGMMEDSLLIVTADHGVSFRPRHSRRLPDADNLAELMSVPLLIHYPGQTTEEIDDRNVESIDVLPTITDVLGINLPQPVDGISIKQDPRRPRKSLYFQEKMTAIEPDFPQKVEAVKRQWAVFGDRELEQPPDGIATHPEWHGRPVDSFTMERQPLQAQWFDSREVRSEFPAERLVPGLVRGRLAASDLPEQPAELLVAVDGIIRDSGKSFPRGGNSQGFEFVLPRSLTANTSGQIELFLIDRAQAEERLRPIQLPQKIFPLPGED